MGGMLRKAIWVLWILMCAGMADAHVSERGIVLLLPTGIYIRAGVGAVLATVFVLIFVPKAWVERVFRRVELVTRFGKWPSVFGFGVMAISVASGIWGTRDPNLNPLVLLFWTGFWIVLPVLQVCFGDIWAKINPWSGVFRILGLRGVWRLPARLGVILAIIGLGVVGVFAIADIAPDDPFRLAKAIGFYWAFTFSMMVIFGEDWLRRGEAASVYLSLLSRLAPKSKAPFPGARIDQNASTSLGLMALVALGIGSFDGLNETFWWLGKIGINPLAFPGRSAVAIPNSLGLLGSIIVLIVVFSGAVWVGLRMVGARMGGMFGPLALATLPIAAGYHLAHYLTSFLINSQYALVAASDPMGSGADYLHLGAHYVSTGYMNTPHSVALIWLVQAAAIVIGHIIAILVAHEIALRRLGSHRAAVISQLPVAGFMVAYTFFGLWLLSVPTGA